MTVLRLLCFAMLAVASGAFAASCPLIEEKRASFESGGRRISVQTFAPQAAGRFPAVLVLHSSAGTLVGKGELERFSRALAERGMIAFFVRYFDRTGTIFAGDTAIERHLHTWETTVADAMNFVATHPRVRADSIGIFGYSLGAFLAVSTASRDLRVDAVAELAGGIFDYLGGRLRRVPPTLVMHGTADQRVEPRFAHELIREARRLGTMPVVKLYPGEGHVLSATSRGDATRRAVDFLARQLHARAPVR